MTPNDLIIDFLREEGFPVHDWRVMRWYEGIYGFAGPPARHEYKIHGIHHLVLAIDNRKKIVKLTEHFPFEVHLEDPDSLDIILSKMKELYTWLRSSGLLVSKNTNTGDIGEEHESQQFCSRNGGGNSGGI